MVRRFGAAVAGVVLLVGVGASPPAAQGRVGTTTVVPHHGNYTGTDGHDRTMRLHFDGHAIRNITVTGRLIVSSAPVDGVTVHHTCDPQTNKCVSGHWISDMQFKGTWSNAESGFQTHFHLHLYSY